MMRRLRFLVAAFGFAAFVSGCQTTSVQSVSDTALTRAGYVRQASQRIANPASAGTPIFADEIYVCEADRCGAKAIAIRAKAPESSSFFGMTMEEAIRKKALKDSTWEDVLNACFKSLQQNASLERFTQFSNAEHAGASFEIVGFDSSNRKVYGAGRLTFKGNSGTFATVMSHNRNTAQRGLALLVSGK